MKYMTIVAQTMPDGSVASAMTAYDTLSEAQAAFHSELAAGLRSEALAEDMCAVLGADGRLWDVQRVEGRAESQTDTSAEG